MEKNKKSLKETNPAKYYKRVSTACYVGEMGSLMLPIGIIFGCKFDEYFSLTDGNCYKMTIGCIVCLVVAAIITYKKVKFDEAKEGKKTMLSWIVGLGLAFVLSWLFNVILNDLTLILGSELAGACAAYGLDLYGTKAKNFNKIYNEEVAKREAQKSIKLEEDGTSI